MKKDRVQAENYRRCHGCGKTYHRVNTIDVWTIRNEGHRLGWNKQKVKLCNKCCTARQAERMMTVAHMQVIPVTSTRRIANGRQLQAV